MKSFFITKTVVLGTIVAASLYAVAQPPSSFRDKAIEKFREVRGPATDLARVWLILAGQLQL